MKKPQIDILFLFATLLFSLPIFGQNGIENQKSTPEVEVFIFHTERRCTSCKTMESSTLQILKNNFTSELKSGKIEYRVININKQENKKYIERYQLIGSSLIIEGRLDGKLRYTNLTTEAFAYARFGKEKFEKIVITNIKKYFKQ